MNTIYQTCNFREAYTAPVTMLEKLVEAADDYMDSQETANLSRFREAIRLAREEIELNKETCPTVCIQVGNSDDKLTQREWSDFCLELLDVCKKNGQMHFVGSPSSSAPHQNFCIVVVPTTRRCLEIIRGTVSVLGGIYKQDSVAWLSGEVDFI